MNADGFRTVVGIIGNVISILLFTSPIPTFVAIIKQKSVQEFKPDPYVATVLSCAMWVFYGMPFVHPDTLLVATINGAGIAIEAIYVSIFFIYSTNVKRKRICLAMLVELAFFIIVVFITLYILHGTKSRSMLIGILCIIFNIVMYASPLTVMGDESLKLSGRRILFGFSAGGGISSGITSGPLLGIIGSFAYSHRNLFGRNPKLNVSLERGQVDSIFRINHTEPWIEGDDKRTSRSIMLQNSRFPGTLVHGNQPDNSSLTIGRVTTGVEFSRPLRPKWIGTEGIIFQHKVIKTKSVKYMPFLLSFASFCNGVIWLTYALIKFDIYVTIPNGLGALFGLAQLIPYATFYRTTNWKEGGEGDGGKPSESEMNKTAAELQQC